MTPPLVGVGSVRAYEDWRARWLAAADRWPGLSIDVLDAAGAPHAPPTLVCMRIPPQGHASSARRVVLTAGIHGDEPAGVEALTRLLEDPCGWAPALAPFDVTIFPCANPTGFERNTRSNQDGIDLNRTFGHDAPPRETAWIQARLRPNDPAGAFDAAIEFHEDVDGEGFYLYELAAAPPYIGEAVIGAVRHLVPADPRPAIEGLPASRGVIRPSPAHLAALPPTQWPQAVYSFHAGIPSCLTLETPSARLPLERRAEIHLAALKAALAHHAAPSAWGGRRGPGRIWSPGWSRPPA